MKKTFLTISYMSLIIALVPTQIACFQERYITGIPRPPLPPEDDVYASMNNSIAATPPASYQVFYDELAPYGSWIEYPTYGYVWIPRVSPDFHPYATQGYWVMTNYGWTWVSDFRWGWAAFHYGRWAYEPLYGWLWIPGSVWSPAWVDWRESDDYYGWAPLGPFMTITVNIVCPFDHYRFVPRRHFARRDMYSYCVDRHQNPNIINRTRVIDATHVVNNRKYYDGPRKDMVEKDMGQKIRTARVTDNPKADADVVDKNRVKVYRPKLEDKPTDTRRATPKQIVPTTELQPIPTDKRLTPSIRRENTEGGTLRPQDKEPRRQSIEQDKPVIKPTQPRPDVQPRRDETPQPPPNIEPRRDELPQPRRDETPQPRPNIEPRRDERPQPKPDVQPMPKDERPKFEPRRDDAPQVKPSKSQPKTEQPRPKFEPRRQDAPQVKPPKSQPKTEQPRKERVTPPPVKKDNNKNR